MQLLTEDLKHELFDKLNSARESVIIISPFISESIATKLVEIIKGHSLSCTLITRFDRELFINRSSSIEALKLLQLNGVEILALKNLHSKVYIMDNEICLIGSANFTHKGLNENKELLMLLDEVHEAMPVIKYANNLYNEILNDGNWIASREMIEQEVDFKKNYTKIESKDTRLDFKFGAILGNKTSWDEDEIVLSVSIGGTYDLVEKYAVHAHPNTEEYKYKNMENLITFRYPSGGQMKAIYEIIDTLEIDVSNWRKRLESLDYSEDIKHRLSEYILERQQGFQFEKTIYFKFYILESKLNLTHFPRPNRNNAGGWYYRLGDLLNESIVNTFKDGDN
ncbi:phospholipase D family protein [Terribacillus saccharophilus]|uniref:phospholipase D family protein n=1 Tax=Terribacillus saccharophilus TaxID=361277 RepID=UPI0039822DB6